MLRNCRIWSSSVPFIVDAYKFIVSSDVYNLSSINADARNFVSDSEGIWNDIREPQARSFGLPSWISP